MPAPHHSRFFKGRMPFLPPNQQRQSNEGNNQSINIRLLRHDKMQANSATFPAAVEGCTDLFVNFQLFLRYKLR